MTKLSTLILITLFFNFFTTSALFAGSDSDTYAKKALKIVQKEYSQNLIPALNILQRDNQDELFIKGWKVENAFERILMLERVNTRNDPYLEINKNYDLAVKSRYNKYRNIYIISYLFALGDNSEYVGFYWWVDPVNFLILDISNNKRLCRKYRLRQYSSIYSTTLRLKRYENELQKLKSEMDM
ncbi:hypothetical protein KAJ27_20235 [bacterium]|nr:hypothetical protein [bacterium]